MRKPTEQGRAVTLVTGASGFLGGAVCRALVARGDRVRAFVRRTSDPRNVPRGVEVVYGDVAERGSLTPAMRDVGAVFHCAGVLGQAGISDDEYVRAHVDGTRNVVREACAAGASRIVYVSSTGVVGPTDAEATEDAPLRPTNAYERSKADAERAVFALPEEERRRVVLVRPEFVYGPGDHHVLGLFQAIAKRRFFYVNDGSSLCHPTYIDDAVAAILAAEKAGERAGGRVYHVAGPRPVSVRELGAAIAGALGVPAPFVRIPERPLRVGVRMVETLSAAFRKRPPLTTTGVDFFSRSRVFDTTRARHELAWSPRVGIEEGARRTVAWYREQHLIA